jgi:hypothetical protein
MRENQIISGRRAVVDFRDAVLFSVDAGNLAVADEGDMKESLTPDELPVNDS